MALFIVWQEGPRSWCAQTTHQILAQAGNTRILRTARKWQKEQKKISDLSEAIPETQPWLGVRFSAHSSDDLSKPHADLNQWVQRLRKSSRSVGLAPLTSIPKPLSPSYRAMKSNVLLYIIYSNISTFSLRLLPPCCSLSSSASEPSYMLRMRTTEST